MSQSIRLLERRGTEIRLLSSVQRIHADDIQLGAAAGQPLDHKTRHRPRNKRHVTLPMHAVKRILLKGFRKLSESVSSALMPASVREEYWRFMAWKNAQRCVASVMSTMATQSLLLSVGVGARRSLPAAAGLQWVLKDGMGRIGRLAFVASMGASLDCHLKPVRFATSVLFTLCLGLEMLTPHFPRTFLLLATLANTGKSIALAASVATNPSIHKAFSLPHADNLSDISAKGQAQTVIADNIGLGVAVLLSPLLHTTQRQNMTPTPSRLPLLIYSLLAALDLICVRKEIRAVPLRTLNLTRIHLLAHHWLSSGKVLTASQVALKEPLLPSFTALLPSLPSLVPSLPSLLTPPSPSPSSFRQSTLQLPPIRVVPLHQHPLSLSQLHGCLIHNSPSHPPTTSTNSAAAADVATSDRPASHFHPQTHQGDNHAMLPLLPAMSSALTDAPPLHVANQPAVVALTPSLSPFLLTLACNCHKEQPFRFRLANKKSRMRALTSCSVWLHKIFSKQEQTQLPPYSNPLLYHPSSDSPACQSHSPFIAWSQCDPQREPSVCCAVGKPDAGALLCDRPVVYLSFSSTATAADVMGAVLKAHASFRALDNGARIALTQCSWHGLGDCEESPKLSSSHANALVFEDALRTGGWHTHKILLPPSQQWTYEFTIDP